MSVTNGSCATLRGVRVAAFVIALTLLSGCSGSSGGGSGGSGPPSVRATAEKIGCSGLEETTTDRELFTAGQASCSAMGDTVNIRTFDSNTARDNWLKTAREFGGRFVVADRTIVYGEQSGTADQLKAKIGGQIET